MTNFNGYEFKHQNKENYGEGKKVTEEILSNDAENGEYLYRRVNNLKKETPAILKYTNAPPIHTKTSYGITLRTETTDHTIIDLKGDEWQLKQGQQMYKLSDAVVNSSPLTFNQVSIKSRDYIDYEQSTAKFNHEPDIDPDEYGFTVPRTKVYIPRTENKTPIMECTNYWNIGIPNDSPYVPDRSTKENPTYSVIPSIARAITFKAKRTGILRAVDLNISTNKNQDHPLIIEITRMNAEREPESTVMTLQDYVLPSDFSGVYNFKFNKPPKLLKGTEYAIIVRSPLSHFKNSYLLGGWTYDTVEKPYSGGITLYSRDNGTHWSRSPQSQVGPVFNKHGDAPIAYAFKCYVEEEQEFLTTSNTPYRLYSQVLPLSPINTLKLNPVMKHIDKDSGNYIEFQISIDGYDWYDFNEDNGYSRSDITTTRKRLPGIMFRANIYYTDTSSRPPILRSIDITANTELSTIGYLVTKKHYSQGQNILSTSSWNEISTPVIAMQGTTYKKHLGSGVDTVITYQVVPPTRAGLCGNSDGSIKANSYQAQYTRATGNDPEDAVDTEDTYQKWLTENMITNKDNTGRTDIASWLMDNCQVLISGMYSSTRYGATPDTYYSKNIKLPHNPVYPLIGIEYNNYNKDTVITTREALKYIPTYNPDVSEDTLCSLDMGTETSRRSYFSNSENTGWTNTMLNDLKQARIYVEGIHSEASSISEYHDYKFSEWQHYTVDYDENMITLRDSTLNLFSEWGSLEITYNKILVKDIKDETISLALFEDTYTVTNNQTSYELKTETVEGGVQVIKNNIELTEGVDFTVDYSNSQITIPSAVNDDIININYVPRITDDTITIIYELERTDTTKNIYIPYANVKCLT